MQRDGIRWCRAIVISTDGAEDTAKVHYAGWANRYDTVLPMADLCPVGEAPEPPDAAATAKAPEPEPEPDPAVAGKRRRIENRTNRDLGHNG